MRNKIGIETPTTFLDIVRVHPDVLFKIFSRRCNHSLEVVKWLVKNFESLGMPARIFEINQDRNTILHQAILFCDLSVMQFIMNYFETHGRSDLIYASGYRGETVLHRAVTRDGSLKLVEYLVDYFERHGTVDFINQEENSWNSALSFACSHRCSDLETLRLLTTKVGDAEDFEKPNQHGTQPIHYAADARDLGKVMLLVSLGADIDAMDGNGCTALQIVVEMHEHYSESSNELERRQCKSIADFLVSRGANPFIRNTDGSTKRIYAPEVQQEEQCSYKQEHEIPQ